MWLQWGELDWPQYVLEEDETALPFAESFDRNGSYEITAKFMMTCGC